MDLVRRGRGAHRARALCAIRLPGARRQPQIREARAPAPARRALFDAGYSRRRGARGPHRAMAEPGVAEPRRRSVQCASPKGLHRIAYLEWGDPRNRDVLVCVHGLTRSSRDFDELARALCSQFRVACPDLAGRGDSERLIDPLLYTVPQYFSDMVTLIARLDAESVHWLGTSLGGFVGMALAAQAGTPVKRLVLNDAGPFLPRPALERIASYVGKTPVFASLDEAEQYIRAISAPFGPHSEAQWPFLTENWVRKGEHGKWRPHYDPRIVEPLRGPLVAMALWHLYDAVPRPTP